MEFDPATNPNDDSPCEMFFSALRGDKPEDKKKIYDSPQLDCYANPHYFPLMLLYKIGGYNYLLCGSSEHRHLTSDMFEKGMLMTDKIPLDDHHECKEYGLQVVEAQLH
eukprot:scaffold320623_cov59-Attheya_sp.AAC.2